jgi:hypothetical protein
MGKEGSQIRTEPDCSTSRRPFWDRLAETVAWCAGRADPANPQACLRDPYLAPRPLEPSYFEAVHHVALNRQLKLGRGWLRPTQPLSGGRLLVYFPDAELSDGAAEAETGGYFDVFNTPPWDTWVAFVHEPGDADSSFANYLIAWVPPSFVGPASMGIRINPEGCIAWLDESRLHFAGSLHEVFGGRVRES